MLGSNNFLTTINELKHYLKFNLIFFDNKNFDLSLEKSDGLITNEIDIKKKINLSKQKKSSFFKVLVSNEVKERSNFFDYVLNLPTSVKEINDTVESEAAKKKFIKNSSIEIKSYLLDKNEKKLSKENKFIILTEKEIQLIDLLLRKKKSISKNDILSEVWNYSSDADTHTVETHIYRLRKKINTKFHDETFILNDKQGYFIWEKEIK